ncbi:MAG: tetratricopeptide repeat protein [Acidobacteriota bacterium]
MAFEKAKVLKAAEKFLSQGKINAAIKEYRQIVENDDDDLTTLNMLGDLCVRAKQNEEAIACFLRIAEHFREREFTLKAIAMYKKIDRLKPKDPAIAQQLATLYAAQGLTADARAQYLIVADAHTRAGKTKQTLDILHKVANLDPHNTEIRLKLAEGYLAEGLSAEAGASFREAGNRLLESGQFEKSLNAYSQALKLFPNDETALKGVVSAHVAMGSSDEAAEMLERMVAEKPDDRELISLLAHTYVEAEDARGAERATAILLRQDATSYARFLEVARAYLKSGELDDATRILGEFIEQLLSGREENDLLELVNEVLARDPEHVEALRLLVRVHWWQRDMDNLRAALERLLEAAQASGQVDHERYALTQLSRISPDDRYAQRLAELGGAPEDFIDEAPFGAESAASQTPTFESFAMVTDDSEAVPAVEEVAAAEFEFNSVAEEPAHDPSSSFADLSEGADDSAYGLVSGTFESSAGIDLDTSTIQATPDAQPEVIDEARRESLMQQELESVDFYIAQGYVDIAGDTLDLMQRQFGAHPEIDLRRRKLSPSVTEVAPDGNAGELTETPVFEFGAEAIDVNADMSFAGLGEANSNTQQVVPPPNGSQPVGTGKGIDAGLAAIFEEFRVAAEEEPTTGEDYETHYNMGTAYKEMDLLDEAIQEFQAAAGLTIPGDGTARYLQCCNMLGHCFMQKELPRAAVLWFKKGLEAPGQGQEEYKALRYELGVAYEQMGDITRARDSFTEVYGVDVSYRGVADRLKDLESHKSGKKRRK